MKQEIAWKIIWLKLKTAGCVIRLASLPGWFVLLFLRASKYNCAKGLQCQHTGSRINSTASIKQIKKLKHF